MAIERDPELAPPDGGEADGDVADRVIVVHPPLTGDRDGDAMPVGPDGAPRDDDAAGVASRAAPDRPGAAEPFDADGPVPDPAAGAAAAGRTDRAAGLDAFRGLFLLAMNFAFTVPFAVFAQWMYHIQYPSPTGEFAPIAGLGWRDTLFGGFLFAMAAALPITMGRRLDKGKSYPGVLWIALKRAFLLFVFALIIGHVNPYWTGDYTKTGNVMAMIGFVVCFWLFTRRHEKWDERWFRWARMAGWVAAAALLFWGPRFYGETFSLARRDGIIAAIAFAALAGTALWLLTRRNLLARLAIVAVVLAFKLAAREPGWVQRFWESAPAPWLYESWYLELLLIVIPGTIAGDLLNRWMRAGPADQATIAWTRYRLILIALACAAFVPIVLIGTYTRMVATTTLLVIGLGIGGALLCQPARSERERVIARLFWWGAFWLGFGMLLEPFEGGIKKVPQTLSYLFVSAGLSSVLLLLCVIAADVFGGRRRLLRPLIDVGQNPMLAYVVYMLFVSHLLYYFGVGDFLSGDATQATLRGSLVMVVVSALVWAASRARLFWRA